jgi:hypothetical protein
MKMWEREWRYSSELPEHWMEVSSNLHARPLYPVTDWGDWQRCALRWSRPNWPWYFLSLPQIVLFETWPYHKCWLNSLRRCFSLYFVNGSSHRNVFEVEVFDLNDIIFYVTYSCLHDKSFLGHVDTHKKCMYTNKKKQTPWFQSAKRTIPTERQPLVGEVSANFSA